eukprot:653545-Prymnesium_polylepis.1
MARRRHPARRLVVRDVVLRAVRSGPSHGWADAQAHTHSHAAAAVGDAWPGRARVRQRLCAAADVAA